MDKIILLLENQKIVMTNDIEKYHSLIKYLLLQADNQLNTYILHEYKPYMELMDEAIVTFESVITHHTTLDMEYEKFSSPMSHVEKKLTRFTDLIIYLNSLNRIRYYNQLALSNDCPYYDEIQFCYFKIEIFSMGKLIYKNKSSCKDNSRFLNPLDILMDITKIYDPIVSHTPRDISDGETFLSISPKDKYWQWGWRSKNKTHIDDMCGVVLGDTKTLTFFNIYDLNLLGNRLSGMQCQTVSFNVTLNSSQEIYDLYDNSEEFDKICGAIRLIDIWTGNIPSIIEYIVYLPYIFLTLKTISEINDYGKLTDEYKTESRIYLELQGEGTNIVETEINCTDEDPIEIMDIVELCKR